MRFIHLLVIVLLFSCESRKETIAKNQQAIKEEMEQVKRSYFKKQDSLDNAKLIDTSSAKRLEIAAALVAADNEKSAALIKLQKEYDSLGQK
ncbi:MAG: hypothetical protein GXC78_06850 [Chitinophagaceae bacterium]|nr:hypothetical protein [Chitinophagaceae bacterium]